ncbi:hypothetical protein SLS55_009736 [Diplodia seriata]|uniref:Uncharacterized protein n=1 Tax=Diplodia seriata TaxID=420778 RepID=A0ABR3C0V7_9PEZI
MASTNPESNWDIYLDNDVYYNKHCGNGCLDNIRGKCGDVLNWGCARNDAGQAHMTFSIANGCTSDHMTQALKKCTKGEQTIECSFV